MSANWRESVNQSVGTVRIGDINSYAVPTSSPVRAPIDIFYAATQDILKVANPKFLSDHPAMGPLLLVGLVSATENYFRDLFARIIQICPISQKSCAEKSINLGSVVWHRGIDFERGAFEHLSLASKESVVKTCRGFLDYEPVKTGAVAAMLDEFDEVCELRHGIVHSGSMMAGKNALKLQIGITGVIKIEVDFNRLQECGAICTTLVASFNTELFEVMAKRWAVDWRRRGSWWNPAKEHSLFKTVWQTFYSVTDSNNRTITNELSMRKCKNRIIKEFT